MSVTSIHAFKIVYLLQEVLTLILQKIGLSCLSGLNGIELANHASDMSLFHMRVS